MRRHIKDYRYNRIIIPVLFLLFLNSINLYAQVIRYPMFLYGPTATASTVENMLDTSYALAKMEKLQNNIYIQSGFSRSFVLLCPGQMIELSPKTKIFISSKEGEIELLSGQLNIHIEGEEDTERLCYDINTDDGSVGFVSSGSIKIKLNDERIKIKKGKYELGFSSSQPSKKWIKSSNRDGQYILELLWTNILPDPYFRFDFPSTRPNRIRFSTREKSGVATYKQETYYHFGSFLKFRMKEFEFVYNIWLAAGPGGFYSDNWDEWQDYIDNIHYIRLFQPSDPFYLRIGMVDRLTLGRGYIMEKYNNTVLLPFEHLNGLQVRYQNDKYFSELILNDIVDPVIAAFYLSWKNSSKLTFDVTYVGDFDQYSNINDSDGDSYPDRVDPEIDVENTVFDSIIIADSPLSMDDVKPLQLHVLGFGLKYHLLNLNDYDVYVTSDFGVLSEIGMGVSAPNLLIEHDWFSLGVGTEFQSPDFEPSIFDRSYEYNKARFVKNEDGELELTTRASEISLVDEWSYGWNSSIKLKIPSYVTLSAKYRNVQVGEDYRDRDFTFSIKSKYQFNKYIRSYGFFIEQKNFEKFLKDKTDGQIWGMQISTQPTKTIRVDLRYREQYQDKNGDGEVTSKELERNITFNVSAQIDQWFRKKKG